MKSKSNKLGITLIALIITIIVLLILAGVSINLVLGDNGIITKAQEAVAKNQKASLEEEVQMLISEWQADYYTNQTEMDGNFGTTTSGYDVVVSGNQIIAVDNSSDEIITYVADYSDGIGEFKEATKDSEDASLVQAYNATHPEGHIPSGFEATGEGTWSTGFVIEGKADAEDKQIRGSQFVWVPVVNEAYYSKKSGSTNRWMLDSTPADGNDGEIDVTIGGGYILGDVLGVTTILDQEVAKETTSKTDLAEKEVVCNAGGFWVGRYEMGIDNPTSDRTTREQNSSDRTTLYSKAGCEPVRNISWNDAIIAANGWIKATEKVQSGLITGAQWDAMCKFIGWDIANGEDCNTWGNYGDSTSKSYSILWHSATNNRIYWVETEYTKASGSAIVFPTGIFVTSSGKDTSQKNIYDIAGNVWEWTTEVPQSGNGCNRVCRGGGVRGVSGVWRGAMRDGSDSTDYEYFDLGFRIVLYVKSIYK